MSKTVIAIEHDHPTLFENGSQTRCIGDVRVHSSEIPDADEALLVGPERGSGCMPAVGERWDCTWTSILDAGMS